MLRKSFACLLIIVCVGFFLRWLLGDDFGPWVDTAKESVKERFVKLIDEYQVELKKAQAAVKAAEQRAVTLRVQQRKAAAGLVTVDREIKLGQQEIAEAKTKLAGLRDNVGSGQTIRLVSGRAATDVDLRDIVDKYATNIELAQEKVAFLEQIRERRKARNSKLAELDKQSPGAIQRLQNSITYLEQKMALYREIKDWVDQEEAAESELTGLYDRAQRTLEDAHSRVDTKLTEIDAMLTASLEVDVSPASEDIASDGLVEDIRSILGEDATAISR